MGDFFLWAHRGASRQAPENTLAAFMLAEEQGADGIELDVHLSRDGVPVVIHDETLERTTDGHGPVSKRSAVELRRLDAGGWFAPAYRGEPIPTLEAVLDWAGDRLRLNIEIKSAAAGRAVLELLRPRPDCRVLVSSFDHRLLARLREMAADLPLGFLSESRLWRGGLRRAITAGAESFNPREDRISPAMLSACQSAGLAVYPWTVDDPKRLLFLARRGVSGLFTNDPSGARRALAGSRVGG